MTIDTTNLRELAMKATPGPWYSKWPEERCAWKDIGPARYPVAYTGDCFDDAPNAEYIAAANPAAALALLYEIDRLRSDLDGAAQCIANQSQTIARLLEIEKAVHNLVKVKGRHNTEIAMNQLLATLAATE